jgi:CxxC-x17-CxxC domain-containing protein
MEYVDKILTCAECRKEFPFTAGGQKFFAEMGFTEPKRCKRCRRGHPEIQKQVFMATCPDCGEEFSTHLRPNVGRLVYCKNCYSRNHHAANAA